MRHGFVNILIFILLQVSCTYYSYTDPISGEDLAGSGLDKAGIEENISSVRKRLQSDPEDPALHRRLAILYRLQGTPRSRARSIEAIDRAIAIEPYNPMNHVEKGITFHEMRFAGESEASFKKALDIDPGLFPAWYNLGKISKEEYLENMCFTEDLEDAIRFYKKAYNIENRHEDTIFNLGFLYLLSGRYDRSKKFAALLCEIYPDSPRSWLLSGSLCLRLGDFQRSEKDFDRALAEMNDDERSMYRDLAILLPPEKRDEYLVWPEEARTSFDRRFWLMNDPNMATEVNERLLAHYYRVFFARELLTIERLGLDGAESARGQALISYGLPERMLYSLGGGTEGPMVIWEYENEAANFRLYFLNEFLNGDYHIPIAPEYSALSDKMQNIFDTISQSYQYPVRSIPVTIAVGTSQRRGANDDTRLEFSVAFPDTAVIRPGNIYRISLFAFDGELNRITDKRLKVRPDTLKQIEKSGRKYYLCAISTDLAARAGDCIFGIEFSGSGFGARGTWKDLFGTKNFGSGPLKISSIRLLAQDRDGICTGIVDPIPSYSTRSGLCLSYDIYNLKRDDGNLARYSMTYSIHSTPDSNRPESGFRNTLFWIKRSITGPRDESPPYITSTIEQSINDSEASDLVMIDIGALRPGRYVLALTVKDLVSGETVSEEASFRISE